MATTFPETIQTFPVMQDLTEADMGNVKNYQNAMLNGNFSQAAGYLSQITNASKKIINAEFINTIVDTLKAVEEFYLQKFNPSYIVSTSQPADQDIGDFWFQVVT